MKKLNYLLLGAAGLLMASCANDDLQAPGNGDGLKITINLCADPGTRADEVNPTGMTLNYAVYDSENALVEEGSTTFTGTSTTFNTNLLSGKDYTLAFFAQVTEYESAYTFSAEEKSVTANYGVMTEMEAFNSGGYDCFYGTYAYPASGVTSDISVTLYRPVAQVNWGTNDLTGKIAQTFPTVYSTLQTEAYKQFNLLNGEMSGKEKVTLGPVQAPTAAYPSVGTSNYTYVGMQYLLATNTSEVYDLNLAISNNNGTETGETVDLVVTSAPLQANYRTNIYGSLLTDNVNLNIELAEWGGSNNINAVWDGKTVSYPNIDTDNKTAAINGASDLAGLADLVNGNNLPAGVPADFSGYTFTLVSDIDMGGNEMPMIGSGTRSGGTVGGNSFRGVFDGNGKTISNVKVSYEGNEEDDVVGIIPNLDGESAEFKNVTFDNVVIEGGASQQAGVIGTVTGGAKVTNVTVNSGSITSAESAGAIVGRMMLTGTISGCNNGTAPGTGASVSGTGNVGGIVGSAYRSTTDAYEMTVENCVNYGSVTASKNDVGGIVGISCANVIGCVNYGSVTGPSNVGGIVAYQVMNGSVKNCTNNAAETVTATGAYAGGIIGRVAYGLGGAYEVSNPIIVSGNRNFSKVSSVTESGGIIGRWSGGGGECTGNTNSAPALIATGSSNAYVAGILANNYSAELVIKDNVNTTETSDMIGKQVASIYNGTTAAAGSQEKN